MVTPPAEAQTGGAGWFAGIVVLLLLGDGLLRLCVRARLMSARDAVAAAALRLLLPMASMPWICVGFDLIGVPIERLTLALTAVVIAAAGAVVDRSGWSRTIEWTRSLGTSRFWRGQRSDWTRSPAARVLALGAAGLVLFSLVQVGLFVPRAYDALVGYDAVGKVMAYEGALRSTLFTHIKFDPQCVYPPFTSCNQGFWYLFHPTIPRLWVPLLAAGFLLGFWSWVRRWTGSPTAAGLASFVVLLPSELAFHLTVGQTDLPSMVYTTMALLTLLAWLHGRGGIAAPSLFILAATTARTENVLFAAALACGGLLLGGRRRWRALWIAVPSALFFLFWNVLFVKNLLGYDPGAHFRPTLDIDVARMLEVLRLAGTIIATRGAFGEFVWIIPITVLLWAAGRWWKSPAVFDNAQRPASGARITGQLLLLLLLGFVFYMPFFYMWDPVLNPLWTMEHTFKRGFFRFIPGLVIAFVAAPHLLGLLRRCDGTPAQDRGERDALQPRATP